MEAIPEKDGYLGVRSEVGLSDLANWPLLTLCPLQDTAEYVAYVAKDPVNQRGEAWWGALGGAGSPEAGEQDQGLLLRRRGALVCTSSQPPRLSAH